MTQRASAGPRPAPAVLGPAAGEPAPDGRHGGHGAAAGRDEQQPDDHGTSESGQAGHSVQHG